MHRLLFLPPAFLPCQMDEPLLQAIRDIYRLGIAGRYEIKLSGQGETIIVVDVFAEPDLKIGQAAQGGLTRCQAKVALLAAEGLTNAEISKRLGLSVHTVKRHLEVIMMKLAVTSRRHIRQALLDTRSQ